MIIGTYLECNIQVYVGKHIPPHPDEVPFYMEEFNDWLNSEKARDMHSVEFAAVAHYKLVYIHPFIDGNGRTSRLLMNMILMKNGFPPVSIQVEKLSCSVTSKCFVVRYISDST